MLNWIAAHWEIVTGTGAAAFGGYQYYVSRKLRKLEQERLQTELAALDFTNATNMSDVFTQRIGTLAIQVATLTEDTIKITSENRRLSYENENLLTKIQQLEDEHNTYQQLIREIVEIVQGDATEAQAKEWAAKADHFLARRG